MEPGVLSTRIVVEKNPLQFNGPETAPAKVVVKLEPRKHHLSSIRKPKQTEDFAGDITVEAQLLIEVMEGYGGDYDVHGLSIYTSHNTKTLLKQTWPLYRGHIQLRVGHAAEFRFELHVPTQINGKVTPPTCHTYYGATSMGIVHHISPKVTASLGIQSEKTEIQYDFRRPYDAMLAAVEPKRYGHVTSSGDKLDEFLGHETVPIVSICQFPGVICNGFLAAFHLQIDAGKNVASLWMEAVDIKLIAYTFCNSNERDDKKYTQVAQTLIHSRDAVPFNKSNNWTWSVELGPFRQFISSFNTHELTRAYALDVEAKFRVGSCRAFKVKEDSTVKVVPVPVAGPPRFAISAP